MKFPKTLIAGVIAVACTTLVSSPAVFARGYGQGGGQLVTTVAGTCQTTGTCQTPSYQPLSSPETEALVFMREEEKLARDVYTTLYNQWQLPVFSNIVRSEQRHTDMMATLLQTYGVPDPVTDDTVGVFANPQLAGLYAQLVTQGQASALEALRVGVLIEETDIADLQKAISETTHPDIAMFYNNLMKASQNHLKAFSGLVDNLGVASGAVAGSQVGTGTGTGICTNTGTGTCIRLP